MVEAWRGHSLLFCLMSIRIPWNPPNSTRFGTIPSKQASYSKQHLRMDERELLRIREFWGGRRSMTKAEFVAEFLPHPDISDECRVRICDFVFQRVIAAGNNIAAARLSLDQLVLACRALATVGWPCDVSTQQFATVSMPPNNGTKESLHEIIAGVTHFEVDQIAWLAHRFWERCDQRSLSIAEPAFVSSVLSATKRSEVATAVFRLFSEHSNLAIGFKEYVCGLSSLCRGPEAERMKFAVGIWDSDMDGVLSRNDLTELAEFFGFSTDILSAVVVAHFDLSAAEEQQREEGALHIFDFVCLASQSASIREALLSFSNKVWTVLTSSQMSLTSSSSSLTTLATMSSGREDASTVDGSGGAHEAEQDSATAAAAAGGDETETMAVTTTTYAGGQGEQEEVEEELHHKQRQRQHSRAHQRRRRRLGGVLNIGNTCYLGAAIQALANVQLLSGYLLSNQQHFEHLPFVRRYAQMLYSLLVLKETASPLALKECVSAMCSLFADHVQHDAQEFIQFFLDAMHEQLKLNKTEGGGGGTPSDGAATQQRHSTAAAGGGGRGQVMEGDSGQAQTEQAEEDEYESVATAADDPAAAGAIDDNDGIGNDGGANKVWQNATNHWKREVLNSRQGSIVLDLFAGQFLSMLRCPRCAHSSNTFELFTMLQLPIPVSESLLIFFKVVRREGGAASKPIVRYALRIPCTDTIGRVKRLMCERIGGIGTRHVLVVILNKNDGKYNATLSQMFNDAAATTANSANATTNGDGDDMAEENGGTNIPPMGSIPFSDLDIWCFETAAPTSSSSFSASSVEHADVVVDAGGDHCYRHLICLHRQFHFKNSFAVLALNGIGTYTFGTPIVLTFPPEAQQQFVRADELYTLILDYLQRRYLLGGSEKSAAAGNKKGGGHLLFNRALDAFDTHQQNAASYPFELAVTKRDAVWCYKCEWQRFCRGCAIDANSSASLPLDELLAGDCVLTINWRNCAALYLLYNNLAERSVDDVQSLLDAQFLPAGARAITIDDCLVDFCRPERIDGSRCDHCNKPRSSPPTTPPPSPPPPPPPSSPSPLIKQLSFTKLPDILVICLKRFTYVPSLRQFVKQIVPVAFPLDAFDPSKYCCADVPAQLLPHFSHYFCIAIVTHHGQLDYGHYCAYVRDFFSDEWFFCNDNKTYPIKSSEVDTRDAYIVFYQRKEMVPMARQPSAADSCR